MIGKVKKLLFFGLKDELDRFFEKAQVEGYIEFIGKGKRAELPSSAENLVSALKSLRKVVPHALFKATLYKTPDEIAKEVIDLTNRLEYLYEEEKTLKEEIERVLPFGNFSWKDVDYLRKEGKRIFQFLCLKSSRRREVDLPDEVLFVNTDYDLDYFVAINKEKKKYPNMVEIEIPLSLNRVQDTILNVRQEIRTISRKLRTYVGEIPRLRMALLGKLNQYHLERAKNSVSKEVEDAIFCVEAWVPKEKIKDLEHFLENFAISFEEVGIEKEEKEPTYMINRGAARLGEDLVNIYDVPSIQDVDPSMWVLVAFTIFFSMIISDLGYGLVYLIIALLLKYKIPNPKPFMKRFISLTMVLSVGCIVWGSVVGAFFGLEGELGGRAYKMTVFNRLVEKKAEYHLNQRDDTFQNWKAQFPEIEKAKNGHDFLLSAVSTESSGKKNFEALSEFKRSILMEISLLIGIVHIALGFLRYLRHHLSGFGWIICMIGGYLYFPYIIDATTLANVLGLISKSVAYAIGPYFIGAGALVALLLALSEQGLKGFVELFHVIQIFADIMSYLRIYALQLAGSILAITFNECGESLPIIVNLLIIFAGHSINISLSIMGGVIHGLRLNFIEWYRYCFYGDGKLFKPLKILK